MNRVDPWGWWLNLSSGLVIIGSSTFAAIVLNRGWSWPLFAWGAAVGPIWSAGAFYSTKAFTRKVLARVPAGQREGIAALDEGLWARNRATYAGTALLGIGVGIFAAGVHAPAVDIGFTVLWLVGGVLPVLVLTPALLRRATAISSPEKPTTPV